MSKEFSPQTEADRREGIFRFGQRFTLHNVRFRIKRDDLAYYLVYGLIKEALGDGFDLVKPGTEEVVEWNDEFQEESAKHFEESLLAVGLEREAGDSLAAFMKAKGKLKLWAFAQDQYEIKYEEPSVSGNIISGKMDLNISTHTSITKITFGGTAPENPINHIVKVEDVFEIITRPDPLVKNKGISLLEPCWDTLIARYMLISHSAYNMARGGGGIKKQTMKESFLNDANTSIDDMLSQASKFGSSHDSIINLIDEQGNPVLTTEMEAFSSGMPWSELHQEYLIDILSIVDIPVAVWRGLTPGEQVGALVNESSKFDALEDTQVNYDGFYMWYSKNIATFISQDEDFELKWRTRRDLIPQMIERLEAFKSITGRTPKPELVAEMLGLKIEEKDLEEKQEIPDFSGSNGDPDKSPDADDKEEEPLKDEEEGIEQDA